ncbi:MAG: protein kinase [Polyangiaceae bacterium]
MSSGASASLVGRTIAAKFQLLELLGSGAMGDVYRAKHLKLDREVALKILHPSLRHDETFATRFHREARAASRLDHPNCVAVLDFGEDETGLLYIAMELLQGVDLFEVIHKEWPLDRNRIIEIMRQTLAGVAKAHENGIVHRDLKPENIMIVRRSNDDGEEIEWVKVCDFGIAKMNDPEQEDPSERRLSIKGHMMGTPEYMSPEQARGDALDVRSDIYALGVVLYQMLVGRVPFEGPTPLDIAVKHLNNDPVPPRDRLKDIDPTLEVICLTAMSKEKSQRYQSAREMRAVLKAAQDGRPLSSVIPDATGAFPSLPPLYTPPPPLSSREALSGAVRGVQSGSGMTPMGTVAATSQAPRTSRRSAAPFVVVAGLAAAVVMGVVTYMKGPGAAPKASASADSRPEALAPVKTSSAPSMVTAPIPPTLAPTPSGTMVRPLPSAQASSKALSLPVVPHLGDLPQPSPSARGSAAEDASAPFSATHTIRASITSGPTGNLRNSVQSRMGGLRACYIRSLETLGHCAAGQGSLVVQLNDKQMVATATLSGVDFLPSLAGCASMFPGLMIEEPEAQSATYGISFTCD